MKMSGEQAKGFVIGWACGTMMKPEFLEKLTPQEREKILKIIS